MNKPEKLIVEAIIPSVDNPGAKIVSKMTGLEPTQEAPITHSVEDTLHALGYNALQNGYLSIDRQVSRQDLMSHPIGGEPVNKAVVRARPIDRSQVDLTSGYEWSDRLAERIEQQAS